MTTETMTIRALEAGLRADLQRLGQPAHGIRTAVARRLQLAETRAELREVQSQHAPGARRNPRRQCLGKIAYPDLDCAARNAVEIEAKNQQRGRADARYPLQAYACPHCGACHIGHMRREDC